MTEHTPHKAIAVVGLGAVLPDAPDVATFWDNVTGGRYSIAETPPERWESALYYDPDPKAPDKTYSKIGGWVQELPWEPLAWRLPIPPRVAEAMDRTQKMAVTAARQALLDYGHPDRPLDGRRTAVILGNAMAGEKHYLTSMRLSFPEYERELVAAASFSALPEEVQQAIRREFRQRIAGALPEVTEDTMPGELANIISGRVASLYDFHGPNYTVDAACASAMAAFNAAIEGLEEYDYDAAVTGGIDANMGAATFIKFCKIGALSATGTRPYAAGADGFVMGEGAAVFVLKRLEDAEQDGDRIYGVVRGVGGSSDGRGKGITAPNPVGQRLAVQRGWEHAGLPPASVGLIEGHGTSTRVGDVAEVESLHAVFGGCALPTGTVPLGSVKSNIGHLKGAAGAAGMLKALLALYHRVLPPSLNFERPNPAIDFASSPFYVNTELRPWQVDGNGHAVRRAGVSAFGFGGTNFHTVLEEHQPGRLTGDRRSRVAVTATQPATATGGATVKVPPRGTLVLGADAEAGLAERLRTVHAAAVAGEAPPPAAPDAEALTAAYRLAIDYGDAAELAGKAEKVLKALASGHDGMWRALRARGIFRGRGAAPKLAFLYTGQGSQYPGMLAELRAAEPIVADTFAEADAVMEPLLGKPLSAYVFVDPDDPESAARVERRLRQTEITQPAVLTVDVALTRLLAAYGLVPDMVMGHSLGEYGALVAAGCLSFAQALEAVSARGREMVRLSVDDNGRMAAVFAPLEEIEEVLAGIDGYVVVANHNSGKQAVIGGATAAVERAEAAFQQAGRTVRPLPVSHAFHTSIVAPASEPLRRVLGRLGLAPPRLPIVSNASGGFYPRGGDEVVPEMIDLLARQIASPVQFVKGLESLYQAGARVLVEVGPKRALTGFVEDVLGQHDDVLPLVTNHPKVGDLTSFNQALCGLYAAGLGAATPAARTAPAAVQGAAGEVRASAPAAATAAASPAPAASPPAAVGAAAAPYDELGRLFADFLDRGYEVYRGRRPDAAGAAAEAVVVTGAALGLPGTEQVFDDANLGRLLRGEQLLDAIPMKLRREMVDKNITRLVKTGGGGPHFEVIESPAEVIKLAARRGRLDLVGDFGFPADRAAALDVVTELAIAAGIEALRDAGVPLVMRYKTTTKGTRLPERWGLPDDLRDDTGVIFASAFPGYNSLAGYIEDHWQDRERRGRLAELTGLRSRLADGGRGRDLMAEELDRRIRDLEAEIAARPATLDRRFLFRILAMGHSQFAELIGARGPNTQVNAACASGALAVGLAEDWIRAGRCRRVIVVSADDVTSDQLLDWIGAGFLASGAAATDDVVEDAAIPFDRRRHGMLLGMGAAAMVIEDAASARQRGLRPICEVLGAVTANSAFHGTRLDVEHISQMMERLVAGAEARWGFDRHAIAGETMFVSHETYTPARGGSAQAEVHALRQVFGPSADRIVIANTKGYTGHPMGVAMEDVAAIKALETGLVPPVPNHRDEDPELGHLNLSRGGYYPVRYALRLAAGFGSQISMTLMRWVASPDGSRRAPDELGYAYRIADRNAWQSWLARISGDPAPELEVAQRTLRLRDRGHGTHAAAAPAAAAAEPAAPAGATAEPRPTAPRPEPAPAAAPEPAPAPPAPAAAAAGVDPVEAKILDIVAGQTGYPADMLDPELDLEADLGIDTVKQAEMFAAIRTEWDIPRDENLQLRDFPTLAHAVGFVYDRRPDLEPTAAQAAPAAAQPAPAAAQAAPAAPATDAAAAETPAPDPAAGVDPVEAKILDIVAGQTGYPADMLDPELDLEADLGIDTVKQAEMFAAIRTEWDIPRDENLQLRDFPTLAHAVGFVYDRRPDLRPQDAGSAGSAGSPDSPDVADVGDIAEAGGDAGAAVAEAGGVEVPRRVPVAVLRPPLELFAATGVELGEGSRAVLMPDRGGVATALAGRLAKRGVEVLTVDGDPAPGELAERLRGWRQTGPVTGLYWLAALDDEGDAAELDAAAWRAAIGRRVHLLYTAARELYEPLGAAGAFLVAATRLGGRHGYDTAGARAPLGGAVTGFTKAFARERPEALVKAVDFAPSRKTAALADRLVAETLGDPGAVEIGYAGGRRWTVGLEVEEIGEQTGGLELGPDSVFVVTGAAGSIVSAIVADLATATGGGTFHLLDLAPEPDPGDSDVARFAGDRAGLQRDLFERLKAAGERATPARVERELARIERLAAALGAVAAIDAAGGRAVYHRVDLRDAEAVSEALAAVRRGAGRIDVLVHAAGLEISRLLPDKEPQEFDLVLGVKCDGWHHLMRAAGNLPIGAAVVFSSIAGRFGNVGQTDYSAANDFLCKAVSNLRSRRPETRGIALDWTAWAGIGMASRGSIPQVMAAAGIDMLPAELGVPVVRRELTAGPGGEVVVAGRLGAMLEPRAAAGGLDLTAAAELARRAGAAGVMVGEVRGLDATGALVVETRLDPAEQPFLDHHRIGSTPVLPGVMGIEGFAEVASLPFPELVVAAVEEVEFLAPFKFYRDEPRTLRFEARFDGGDDDGEAVVAHCRLVGERSLPGQAEPQRTVHFRARVLLEPASELPAPAEAAAPAAPGDTAVTAEDVYRIYFHGPAYRVVDSAWSDDGGIAGRFAGDLPPNHRPAAPTLMEPRLIELCLQTAGVGELGREGRMALPRRLARVTTRRHPGGDEALFAITRPAAGGGVDAVVVDEAGRVYVELAGYRTVELPGDVGEEQIAALRRGLGVG